MECVVRIEFVQKTSKAGNPYDVIVITFKNGYQLESYVTKDAKYIIQNVK